MGASRDFQQWLEDHAQQGRRSRGFMGERRMGEGLMCPGDVITGE